MELYLRCRCCRQGQQMVTFRKLNLTLDQIRKNQVDERTAHLHGVQVFSLPRRGTSMR